jgi:hypothetical protein
VLKGREKKYRKENIERKISQGKYRQGKCRKKLKKTIPPIITLEDLPLIALFGV